MLISGPAHVSCEVHPASRPLTVALSITGFPEAEHDRCQRHVGLGPLEALHFPSCEVCLRCCQHTFGRQVFVIAGLVPSLAQIITEGKATLTWFS